MNLKFKKEFWKLFISNIFKLFAIFLTRPLPASIPLDSTAYMEHLFSIHSASKRPLSVFQFPDYFPLGEKNRFSSHKYLWDKGLSADKQPSQSRVEIYFPYGQCKKFNFFRWNKRMIARGFTIFDEWFGWIIQGCVASIISWWLCTEVLKTWKAFGAIFEVCDAKFSAAVGKHFLRWKINRGLMINLVVANRQSKNYNLRLKTQSWWQISTECSGSNAHSTSWQVHFSSFSETKRFEITQVWGRLA